MIVCPVCEHQQVRGDACDQCGMRLVAAAEAAAVQIAALPELERTVQPSVAVAVAPMEGLEVHHVASVDVQTEVVPDFEATKMVVPDAPALASVLPEIEQTRIVDDAPKTQLTDTTTCRYCGQAQPRSNRLCDKCANALPIVVREVVAAKVVQVRCPGCGMDGVPSRQCDYCGFFIHEAGS